MTETAQRMVEASYGLRVTALTTHPTPIGWSMYMAELLDALGRGTGLVQYTVIRDHPDLGTGLDAAGEVVTGTFRGDQVQPHWMAGAYPKFPGLIAQHQRRIDQLVTAASA